MRGLEEKRVIVTGGASGIGAATAARFLEEGAEVVVLDLDKEAGEKLATELPGLARVVPCDVSDLAQVQDSVREAVSVMGGIDVLINNAGISIRHDDFLDIIGIDPVYQFQNRIFIHLKTSRYGPRFTFLYRKFV